MIDELVSIVSPSYNSSKYLNNFLDSILAQSYGRIELLFIDDGSTDNTREIVEKYRIKFEKKGYVLKYFYQRNSGQAAAINKGLQIFTGEYFMWVDSDDILLEDNVKEKVSFLKKNHSCGFVICEGIVVNANDLSERIGALKRVKPVGADNFFDDLVNIHNVVFVPGVYMARRDAILRAIPNRHIYESREGQNWQLLLPLAYYYKCGYIDKVLFKCVSHSDSHSRQKRTVNQEIIRNCNFEKLLTETIKEIVDMPKKEKEKWIRHIIIKYELKNLHLAYDNNMPGAVNNARKELKKQGYTFEKFERGYIMHKIMMVSWKFLRSLKLK